MSEVTFILERAWKRIEDPKTWCQEHDAERIDGSLVTFFDPLAYRLCARAALFLEEPAFAFPNPAKLFLDSAANTLFHRSVPEINDGLGHDAVRQMYALAIEKSKAEAA